jgi:hypothetical protein
MRRFRDSTAEPTPGQESSVGTRWIPIRSYYAYYTADGVYMGVCSYAATVQCGTFIVHIYMQFM